MSYTIIIFNATDAWTNPVYSFKINLVSRELSVEYTNTHGGVTTNGIALNESQYNHIKLIASPNIFEKYRNESWKIKPEWLLDPYDWKAQFIYDDGTPMLTLATELQQFSAPPALVTLVNYVMKIGTLGNFGGKVF